MSLHTAPLRTQPAALRGIALPHPSAEPQTALSRCSMLLVPDLGGAIDLAWRRRLGGALKVATVDNRQPDLDAWTQAIIGAARKSARPVVVVAQGFGCLAAVRAATLQPGAIAGALLLAPADPVRFGVQDLLEQAPSGLASVVVPGEGRKDLPLAQALFWALHWESQLASVDRARARRDNGLGLLEQLCRRVLD